MKTKITFLVAFFILVQLKAQEGNKVFSIGVLPVTSSAENGNSHRETVRGHIVDAFSGKSRFTVVDRSRLDDIYKERDLQKQEDFIGGNIIEQAKSIGAEFLVSGDITDVSSENFQKEKKRYPYNEKTKETTVEKYYVSMVRVSIKINLQLMEVATGIVKSTKPISLLYEYEGNDAKAAIAKSLPGINAHVKAWANDIFPIEMKIISVETTDRKGLPKTVLVTGGKEMDFQQSRSAGFGITNTSTELDIIDIQILNIDGREVKRPIVVGKAIVERVEGDLAVCKVKKGEEVVQQKLNEKKSLYLKISSY